MVSFCLQSIDSHNSRLKSWIQNWKWWKNHCASVSLVLMQLLLVPVLGTANHVFRKMKFLLSMDFVAYQFFAYMSKNQLAMKNWTLIFENCHLCKNFWQSWCAVSEAFFCTHWTLFMFPQFLENWVFAILELSFPKFCGFWDKNCPFFRDFCQKSPWKPSFWKVWNWVFFGKSWVFWDFADLSFWKFRTEFFGFVQKKPG